LIYSPRKYSENIYKSAQYPRHWFSWRSHTNIHHHHTKYKKKKKQKKTKENLDQYITKKYDNKGHGLDTDFGHYKSEINLDFKRFEKDFRFGITWKGTTELKLYTLIPLNMGEFWAILVRHLGICWAVGMRRDRLFSLRGMSSRRYGGEVSCTILWISSASLRFDSCSRGRIPWDLKRGAE
jgi:hypothetical protein